MFLIAADMAIHNLAIGQPILELCMASFKESPSQRNLVNIADLLAAFMVLKMNCDFVMGG